MMMVVVEGKEVYTVSDDDARHLYSYRNRSNDRRGDKRVKKRDFRW